MDTAGGKPWLCGGVYLVSVDSSDSNRLSTTAAAEEKAKWLGILNVGTVRELGAERPGALKVAW